MIRVPAFQVRIESRAEREFEALPPAVRDRFYPVFEALEEDPYRPRPGCDIRVLKGHPGIRAVRVGQYRGIYEVAGTEVWSTVFGHRRSVYGR